MRLCPQEMEPPNTLQCELQSYQKQALHWMTQLEIGLARDNAADSLHPCWEAYHLAEGYSSLPFLSYGSRPWKGFIWLCTGCFFVLTYILHQITMDFILVRLTAGQSLHFISMCFLVRQLWISQVLYRQHKEGREFLSSFPM